MLNAMHELVHEVFPAGNACLVIVINKVHTTGTRVVWALK